MNDSDYRYDAFISYSTNDKAWVSAFCKRLEAAGLSIWRDETAIAWGEAIRPAILKGLRTSRRWIIALSPDSLESGWVELEQLIATLPDPANREQRMLPLVIRDCQVPDDIKPFKYLDVRRPEDLARHLPEIIAALKQEAAEPMARTETTSAQYPSLTWLHLSDLHFRADRQWQQDVVLDALMRDVIAPLPEQGLRPDAVFVTGDIAQSGKAAEYRNARTFFDEVAGALDHDPTQHWFLVPGNHDVDRKSIDLLDLETRNVIKEANIGDLTAKPSTWARFAARQQAFLDFTKDFLGEARAWRAEQPWRTDFLIKDRLKVALLCLNSAWTSQDKEDERKLVMGEFQVRDALKAAGDAVLRIALCHHPLDWLRGFDRKAVKGVLTGKGGCHFLLRGHLHETDLELGISPSSALAELAAGACWQEPNHPHSVTLTRMDFAGRLLENHVWSYTPNRGGFWAPANHLYPNMDNGVWKVSFPDKWDFPLPPATAPTPTPPPMLVPHKYRNYLTNHYGYLETAVSLDQAANLKLKACYVPLKTAWLEPEKAKTQDKKETSPEGMARDALERKRPLLELTTLEQHRCFAVRGGAGSGKTTFLRHTALTALGNNCLPILLPLKEMGVWLNDQNGQSGSLLVDWAASLYGDMGLDADHLHAHAGSGTLLWLLDGLDEIFDKQTRLQAATIIGHWISGEGAGDRVLVACRPHALDQDGVPAALGVFEHIADVLPLEDEDQRLFLEKWFDAVYAETPEKAEELRTLLWETLEHQDILGQLRTNPLLLSMIATIYHQGKRLPERRADLYGKAVKVLLDRRFGPNVPNGSEALVGRLRRGLETVAYRMFALGRVRDLGEPDFLEYLAKGFDPDETEGGWDGLHALARDLGCHSGLLAMNGEPPRYHFPHLGFQEYLAAGKFFEDGNPLESLSKHLDDGAWREVVLLTAGRLFESGPTYRGRHFLEALQQRCKDDDPGGLSRLVLAMDAAAEAPADTLLKSVIQALIDDALMILGDDQGNAGVKARASLGLALGRLGDPRLDPAQRDSWVWIEPGRFEMGRNDGNESDKPAHSVHIKDGFFLGKYPVTNDEYALFLKDKGYQTSRWWSPEGLAWRSMNGADFEAWFGALQKRRDQIQEDWKPYFRPAEQPHFWRNEAFNSPNQPVVGVNWFEAEAYCNWLTARLAGQGLAWWPEQGAVHLPSEAQWEFAARRSEGRTYPWGENTPDEARANFNERLENTSPVGIYPAGATPDGLLDLAGNVWEWCRDPWDEKAYKKRPNGGGKPDGVGDPDRRCLRGGAWYNAPRALAASSRGRLWAWDRNGNAGFRCCVVAGPAE